jgi:hypothetical protein
MQRELPLVWDGVLEELLPAQPDEQSAASVSPTDKPKIVINMSQRTAMFVGDQNTPSLWLDIPKLYDQLQSVSAPVSPVQHFEVSFPHKPRAPSLPARTEGRIEKQRKMSTSEIVFVDDSYKRGSGGRIMREKDNKFRKKESEYDSKGFTKYFRIE